MNTEALRWVRRPVVPDVLEEHLEEIAALGVQRRKLLFAHDVVPDQLRDHEERVEAHRWGLSVGAEAGIRLGIAGLDSDDPWQLYAAASTWLSLAGPESSMVLARLEAAPGESLPAWREALRNVPTDALKSFLPLDLDVNVSPAVEGLIVDAWLWHGCLAVWRLRELRRSSAIPVRRALARSISLQPTLRSRAASVLERLLGDEDRPTRRAALWGLLLVSPDRATARCREWIDGAIGGDGAPDPFAIRVLGYLGNPEDSPRLLRSATHEACRAASLLALGDMGRPEHVPTLLASLRDDQAQVALAASTALETLLGELPDALAASPEGAQWPDLDPAPLDPEGAERHWRSVERRFDAAGRWLRGRVFPHEGPPEEETLEAAWRRAVLSGSVEPLSLAREVPDGHLDGIPVPESLPGE